MAADPVPGLKHEPGPNTPSSDYSAMIGYWTMVEAILGGVETLRACGKRFLPRFESESDADYSHRLEVAPCTNVYSDISRNLSSKPFSRELALGDGADKSIETLCEDIDGQGNNLHVFAHDLFKAGIDKGLHWILVDHTRAPQERPASIAAERAAGSRPYWVSIPAERLLAVYSAHIGGIETIVHARIAEPSVERSGFSEKKIDRIRVFNREKAGAGYAAPTFEVFEKQKDQSGREVWVSVEGPSLMTIDVIPLVAFVPGKRAGASWVVVPPLRDVAYGQIDAYQQESNLKMVLEMTAFPMLAGNGISGPSGGSQIRVPVGPRAVLLAPPDGTGGHGEWKFIEPGGSSIAALEAHLAASWKNLRDIGMQPMTEGNLTVVTTANVSMKASSAVQAWVFKLKDALEQALKITVMWLGDQSKDPEVDIHTDFGVDLEAGTEIDSLLKAQAQGVISATTVQEEFKRRGVLSENFDADAETVLLSEDAAMKAKAATAASKSAGAGDSATA